MLATFAGPLILALLGAPQASAPAPKKATPAAAVQRTMQRRTLTIDDTTVNTLPELYVAGGSATVVTFQVPIAEQGALQGSSRESFQIAQTDRTLIIMPRTDPTGPVPLNVTLSDGTVLTFQCVASPTALDAQVDVVLALRKRAATESVAGLKARLGQLQNDLDTCRATAGDAGSAKVAALLLTQTSLDANQAFDRRPLRRTTKENRLLVEARVAYRLLGMTYIVLTVENRDPDRHWALDRASVRLTAGGAAQDLPVKTLQAENPTLPPDASELVVVAFPTVASPRAQVAVTLDEKDGSRSVTLSGLDL